MKLINLPRQNGGTGITNFDPIDYLLYCKAIELSGRKDLVIYSKGLPPCRDRCMSLHFLKALPVPYSSTIHQAFDVIDWMKHQGQDLSDFWKIFDDLRKQTTTNQEKEL